jgi:NAD(P)-dependent dehydrogenase (short-subunit alcohol dehydrogenase family)
MNANADRKAIVVGASSGIGREVALLLRDRGWTVGVAARRMERLADFDMAAQIDVTDSDAGEQLLKLIERVGGMDLYFHASGVGRQNRELHEDIEMQTVATNTVGFTRMVGTAYRYMAANGGGHIAVISSIAGTKGLGPAPSYSATKAMQNTYIEALEQLANARRLGIRFTDIRPGFVDTDLLADGNKYPLMLKKDKVAVDIVRSLERRRHVCVIDWRWRGITWLWRRIPRLLWRRLRLCVLMLIMLTATATMNAQDRKYYADKAKAYMREAEYYTKQAESHDRDAEYYRKKAQGYLHEADYYTRQKNYDKVKTYTRWADEATSKAQTRMRWANESREKARQRMRWADEALKKAK